jgi:uncharacterized protein (DUF2141 family)
MTHFKAKVLYIAFDEWVELDQPQKITISPPLKRRPEFKIKGKGVEIKIIDTLSENTTYAINFGESVRDITERNTKKDLRMVFSTGAVVDSLSAQGSLVNALTGKAEPDVSIMLYAENAPDSIVKKSLPLYFATTNTEGIFNIQNLKQGQYRIFALKDANNDYKFNQASEMIGFANAPVEVSSKAISVPLQLFEPEKNFRVIQQRASQFGKLDLTFMRKPAAVKIAWQDDKTAPITTIIQGDTLTIWHTREGKQTLLITAPDKAAPDTIRFTALPQTSLKTDEKLVPMKAGANPSGKRGKNSAEKAANSTALKKTGENALQLTDLQWLVPNDTFRINFGRPLLKADTARIFLRDSLQKRIKTTAILSAQKTGVVELTAAWSAGAKYTLTLLPAAIEDTYSLKNDSIIYTKIKAVGAKELGTIHLKINSLDAKKQYLVLLTDAAGAAIQSFVYTNKTEINEVIKNKLPANYGMILIEDDNNNGVWDTGDYYKHRQPEKQQVIPAQALRANWELELSASPTGTTPIRGKK